MIARPFLLALGIAAGPWVAASALAQSTPAGPVSLSTVTTPMLAKACRESGGLLNADFCTGYVAATYDALTFSTVICPSRGVSTEQVQAIGRKYLADHPETWDRHPASVLQAALVAVFPCSGR